MQCLCRCRGSVRAARRRSVTRFVSSAHRVRSSRGPARSRSTEVYRARAAARSAGQWLGAARRCLPSPPLPALSPLHPQAARSCLGFTSSQKPPLPAPPEEALHPPFFFSAKPFAAPPFLIPPPDRFFLTGISASPSPAAPSQRRGPDARAPPQRPCARSGGAGTRPAAAVPPRPRPSSNRAAIQQRRLEGRPARGRDPSGAAEGSAGGGIHTLEPPGGREEGAGDAKRRRRLRRGGRYPGAGGAAAGGAERRRGGRARPRGAAAGRGVTAASPLCVTVRPPGERAVRGSEPCRPVSTRGSAARGAGVGSARCFCLMRDPGSWAGSLCSSLPASRLFSM